MTDYPMHPDPSGLDAWGVLVTLGADSHDPGEFISWDVDDDKDNAEDGIEAQKAMGFLEGTDYGLVHLVPEQEVERFRARVLHHIVAFGVAPENTGHMICGTCGRQSASGFMSIRHEQWCKDAEILGLDMDPGTPAP